MESSLSTRKAVVVLCESLRQMEGGGEEGGGIEKEPRHDGIHVQEAQILAEMLGQCSSLAVLSFTHNRFGAPRNHIRCGRVGI